MVGERVMGDGQIPKSDLKIKYCIGLIAGIYIHMTFIWQARI